MEIKTCAFTGHREIPTGKVADLSAHLDASLIALYGMGCRTFYAGGARGFDTLAAERVLAFRKSHPDVTLHLYLPCRDQMRGWPASDLTRARAVLAAADRVEYIQNDYTPTAMAKRNRALIAAADACIAYLLRPTSGSGQTVRLAEQKGIPVINLALRLSEE